jgi:nitrate reductase assembly molybdenum cofactor insertion protein NarJ
MSNPETKDAKVRDLLRQAAEWRLLGLLLEVPSGEWKTQVAILARESLADDVREAAAAAQAEASEGLFHTTFGPGGPSAPREVSYRKGLAPGQYLAELQAFYDAFAYRPEIREPLDHVAVEGNFVGYLRLKEAYALMCDDTDQATVSAEAARRFMCEHLQVLVQPMARSLQSSGIRYLALSSEALTRRAGCVRVGSAAGGDPI